MLTALMLMLATQTQVWTKTPTTGGHSSIGWVTPTGAGGTYVETEVDFGTGGSDTASVVVTGQSWVGSSTVIVCAPSMVATTSRLEGMEDAVIEGLTVAAHTRVAGTGFTVTAAPLFGVAVGKFKVHCTGG